MILQIIYAYLENFAGFEIKLFDWMYTSISYIYVAVAILMIKTEIINQKIQLMRLNKIQEQVSKEVEEQEAEKEEKKEKQNKGDEEKENKKEENTGNEQPEGSNA